jgi:AraC-like DNA-binding protein
VQQKNGFNHRTDEAPILAGRAGAYHETQAILPLRDHFQCVWTNTIHHEHVGRIAVVPDGCVDLVWSDHRIIVAGPDLSSAHPILAPGATLLGLRFQPGAAASWLGLPMSEIVGRRIDLRELWGRKACGLTETIDESETAANRLQAWQLQLLQLLPNAGAPSPEMRAVFSLMKGDRADGAKIRSIRDRLDISERTLRRHCQDHFGYGPKALDRILRFQTFLRIARGEGETGLSDMAFAAGYADQAHLSRDIRALCGMSAGALVRQLAP